MPGGIYATFELIKLKPELKVAVFEANHKFSNCRCPIDGDKIKTCIGCKSCSIMIGFVGKGCKLYSTADTRFKTSIMSLKTK